MEGGSKYEVIGALYTLWRVCSNWFVTIRTEPYWMMIKISTWKFQ